MDGRRRIYILCKSGLLAQGIRSLLGRMDAVRLVGSESDVDKAVKAIRALKPDVLILEDHLRNGANAIDATIREAGVHTVLAVSLDHNHAALYRCETCLIDRLCPDELARTILDLASCRPSTNENLGLRSTRSSPDGKRRIKAHKGHPADRTQLAT